MQGHTVKTGITHTQILTLRLNLHIVHGDMKEVAVFFLNAVYRLPYNLYCVGGDVKHCTIQSEYSVYFVPRMRSLAIWTSLAIQQLISKKSKTATGNI